MYCLLGQMNAEIEEEVEKEEDQDQEAMIDAINVIRNISLIIFLVVQDQTTEEEEGTEIEALHLVEETIVELET